MAQALRDHATGWARLPSFEPGWASIPRQADHPTGGPGRQSQSEPRTHSPLAITMLSIWFL